MAVLIGVITYDGETYCRKEFLNSLKNLTFSSRDIVIVTNSGAADAADLKAKAEAINLQIEVIVSNPSSEKLEEICAHNRAKIREHFLNGDWSHLFFVDSDTFVPTNSVEIMFADNKSIVGGVVLNGVTDATNQQRILPTIWVKKGTDVKRVSITDILLPRLINVHSTGMACVLIAREVLEKISFIERFEKISEDRAFFADAQKAGFSLWIDTRLKCTHLKFPFGDERNKYYDLRNYQLNVNVKK